MFGCSNPSTSTEASNLMKPGKFKSPRFGCKASPTLVSAITRYIGNHHSQGNTHWAKSPLVKGIKENLKKKHEENPHDMSLLSLKESKERATTSRKFNTAQPLPSPFPTSHQSKGNKRQQPQCSQKSPILRTQKISSITNQGSTSKVLLTKTNKDEFSRCESNTPNQIKTFQHYRIIFNTMESPLVFLFKQNQ